MNLKHAVVCAVLILTMGCQKGDGLQLGRAPVVIPHVTSGEFIFSVSVTNFASEVSPVAYLKVLVKWTPHLQCGGDVPNVNAQSEKIYEIHPLQPNEPWVINSELVTKIADDDNCHCLQGACAGTIYFTLLRTKFPPKTFSSEPNQSIKVQWSADGDLHNLVITDLHGDIPQ